MYFHNILPSIESWLNSWGISQSSIKTYPKDYDHPIFPDPKIHCSSKLSFCLGSGKVANCPFDFSSCLQTPFALRATTSKPLLLWQFIEHSFFCHKVIKNVFSTEHKLLASCDYERHSKGSQFAINNLVYVFSPPILASLSFKRKSEHNMLLVRSYVMHIPKLPYITLEFKEKAM